MAWAKPLAAGILALVVASDHALACSEVTSPDMFDALQVAQVKKGQPRVHFYDPSCDSGAKGQEACRRPAFVVAGDVVLVGDVLDTRACVVFIDRKGRLTSGLLRNDSLQSPKQRAIRTSNAFLGGWVREEAEIRVARKGRDLEFKGAATYGAKDPQRVARGAVNTGAFAFLFRPKANRVAVGDVGEQSKPAAAKVAGEQAGCTLDMIALGPYLVVQDNMKCGGLNVSFTGIYRKM